MFRVDNFLKNRKKMTEGKKLREKTVYTLIKVILHRAPPFYEYPIRMDILVDQLLVPRMTFYMNPGYRHESCEKGFEITILMQ